MYFRQFFEPDQAAMSYLLGDPVSGQAVAIDPRPDPCQVLLLTALLAERQLDLCLILLTHTHVDRDDHLPDLYPGAQVVVGGGGRQPAGLRTVVHGERLLMGSQVLQVIATPGHTPCSVSYLWQDRIFCGDALELGGCGRVESGECDPGRLYDSVMNRLFVLPDETLVFPGHDFHGRTVSTIGEERRCNPFFAARSRDAFLSRYAMKGGPGTVARHRHAES